MSLLQYLHESTRQEKGIYCLQPAGMNNKGIHQRETINIYALSCSNRMTNHDKTILTIVLL